MAEKKKPSAKKKAAVKKKPAKQTKAVGAAKKTAAKPKGSGNFPIVGLGASAGGLEALEAFLSHMPSDTGMGFVIIQLSDYRTAPSKPHGGPSIAGGIFRGPGFKKTGKVH